MLVPCTICMIYFSVYLKSMLMPASFIYLSSVSTFKYKVGKCVLGLMRLYRKAGEKHEAVTTSDSLIIVWFVHKSFVVMKFVCGWELNFVGNQKWLNASKWERIFEAFSVDNNIWINTFMHENKKKPVRSLTNFKQNYTRTFYYTQWIFTRRTVYVDFQNFITNKK